MLPPAPIVSLVYRLPLERKAAFLEFLGEAVPLYERPGGIRVGVYESLDEPGLFLELVSYASLGAYEADQLRVDHDPEMVATLTRFKAVVAGPIEVRRMQPIALPGRRSSQVEAAAFQDQGAITALLTEAGLAIPSGDDAPVHFVVARTGTTLLGCVGYEVHPSGALLRSIAVSRAARGGGIGRALVWGAIAEISSRGAREICLLSTDAAPFFEKLGFRRVDRASVSEELRATAQFRSQQCASAACLRLQL